MEPRMHCWPSHLSCISMHTTPQCQSRPWYPSLLKHAKGEARVETWASPLDFRLTLMRNLSAEARGNRFGS